MERYLAPLAAIIIVASSLSGGAAVAAISCDATGDFVDNHDGSFTYVVEVSWDFAGVVVPERVNIVLEPLDDCQYFTIENPFHINYVKDATGTSEAQSGCTDAQGFPSDEIDWVGEVARDYDECWIPSVHLVYTNTGSTPGCLPLSVGDGTFTFTSYGVPRPEQTYYETIVIRAGEYCFYCDYTGPLPDCNMWSPVEKTSWGTIKGLYR